MTVIAEAQPKSRNPESMSQKEILKIAAQDFTHISAVTAIAGVVHVDNQYAKLGRLATEDDVKEISKGMDHFTVPVSERLFKNNARLRYSVVTSEGAKDDAPFLRGKFGPIDAYLMEIAHDAIDGSSLLAARKANSLSLISGSTRLEIIPSNILHMVSITGPAEAKQSISLALDKEGHKRVLKNICEELNISPSELTQIILNPNKKGREINSMYEQAGDEMGTKKIIIPAGDYMPRVFCSLPLQERLRYCEAYHLNPKELGGYAIMVGRGGAPELVAGCAAGKITGASTVAYKCNPETGKIDTQDVYTTNRLVPGDKYSTIAVCSFATDNTWLKQSGVRTNANGASINFTVHSMVLTAHNGMEILGKTYSSEDVNLKLID